MASPSFVAEPASRTTAASTAARLCGALLLLGGLLLLPVALGHPDGNEAAAVLGFPAWTLVHVLGAVGVGLIATSAALRLSAGAVPNLGARAGLAGLVVFGTLLVATLAIDGFASPALAAIDGEPGSDAIRSAVIGVEQGLAAFGYGGFGLAAALVTASHLGRARWAMRVAAGVAILGMVAVAGAGIVYIGMGVDVGFLFAGMPLVAAWFVFVGAREAVGSSAGAEHAAASAA